MDQQCRVRLAADKVMIRVKALKTHGLYKGYHFPEAVRDYCQMFHVTHAEMHEELNRRKEVKKRLAKVKAGQLEMDL